MKWKCRNGSNNGFSEEYPSKILSRGKINVERRTMMHRSNDVAGGEGHRVKMTQVPGVWHHNLPHTTTGLWHNPELCGQRL